MAGFIPYKHEGGDDSGEVRPFVIDNSEALTLGDAVDLNSGYLQAVDAGDRTLGVVVGFVDTNGLPLDADAADFDGTRSGNAGNFGSETYTAASDNQTDKKVQALVNISPHQEYYNDADDDLTAAQIGTYFDTVAAGDQIDQATSGSTGQFVLMEKDPHNDGDDSKGIFRIAEHALQLG